eukprot:CAMPEP_0178443628 /NCGR_PEP_ID=MMETSP0689_2-20121128/39010_1 /TAXON_ID=160604 /ORGANISM="Amphidinium massartii, Strain CS-259" /LENGTH=337 /DNA_ID=CAMNT_0020067675 /DNA_START=220 /DNA_END=1233 /DNA_ORIENTATION=+
MRLAKSPLLAAAALFFNILAWVGWLRHDGTSGPSSNFASSSAPSQMMAGHRPPPPSSMRGRKLPRRQAPMDRPSALVALLEAEAEDVVKALGPQAGNLEEEQRRKGLLRARAHRKKVLREHIGIVHGIANISFVPGFEHLAPRQMKHSCTLMLQLHNDTRFWRAQLKESPYGAVRLFQMLPGESSKRFTSTEALAEYLVDEQKHAPPLTEEAERYLAVLARVRERYARRWEAFNERKAIVESYLGNIRGISKVAEMLGRTNFSFVKPRNLAVICEWLKDKWGEEAARDLVQKDSDGFARFCEQPMDHIDGCKQACQSLEEIAAKFAHSKARQLPEST